MTFADKDDRAQIIDMASSIATNRQDPVRVLQVAGPLVDWVEAAETRDSLLSRMDALQQHWRNTKIDRREHVDSVMDNPAELLRGAEVLLGFLMTNEGKVEVPGGADDEDFAGQGD